ncbi:MAG: aspartyl-phosphate phosphatase Spo0E family protein [Clostridia bacterium]|nr:aspartyl-phosphate phosphatase Spo0E family protein [Clostridia bacterium]
MRVLQNKLNKNIEKYGLSDKKTIELSEKIDAYINYYYATIKERQYPTGSEMFSYYRISYDKLKELTIEKEKFPSAEEWNKYAKEYGLLCSESMKYISMLDWNYLRVKINREINIKIF